jgi:hypothetical protein
LGSRPKTRGTASFARCTASRAKRSFSSPLAQRNVFPVLKSSKERRQVRRVKAALGNCAHLVFDKLHLLESDRVDPVGIEVEAGAAVDIREVAFCSIRIRIDSDLVARRR